MGEMTDAIGGWLSDFLAAHSTAIGPVLLLAVCAAVFGTAWRHRAVMTDVQALAVYTAALVAGFAVIALQVLQHGWLIDLDRVVTTWLVGHRTTAMDGVAILVTNMFGPVETACAAVVVAVLAAARFRSIRVGLIVPVTVGGATALCAVLKVVVGRSRPPLALQETLETDYSFPSGHVTGTVALFGMAVVVAAAAGYPSAARWLAVVAAMCTVSVAFSRMYLGVHWLTDVLAGVLLGSAAVAVGAFAVRRFAHTERARVPQPTEGRLTAVT